MLNTKSYSNNQCECGLLLNFPSVYSVIPGSGDSAPSGAMPNIPAKDMYVLKFSSDIVLPSTQTSITISPESYTVSNNKIFTPQTSVKINSTHNGDTQSLIKLDISDIYNNLLYTDYIKIICSPQKVFKKLATINTQNRSGPNGGVIMSVESTELRVGMNVKDIVNNSLDEGTKILSILSSNSIEISPQSKNITQVTATYYEFIQSNGCALPSSDDQTSFVYLNQNNNWTYKTNDQLIAKFVQYSPYDVISITLSSNNKSRLPDRSQKQNIPAVATIRTSGNTPDKNIGELIYNSAVYDKEDIIVNYNSLNLFGTIKPNLFSVSQQN